MARAVGAQLSTTADRSKVMAMMAIWQGIGFSLGPGNAK